MAVFPAVTVFIMGIRFFVQYSRFLFPLLGDVLSKPKPSPATQINLQLVLADFPPWDVFCSQLIEYI
jgi:hypothetical protein